MAKNKKETGAEQARRANTMIRKRIITLAAVFGALAFLLLFGQLFKIQIIQHDKYMEMAVRGQTSDLALAANRGKITDRKGNNLAMSATVYNVVLSPRDILELEKDRNVIANGLSELLGIDQEVLQNAMNKTDRRYEVVARRVEDAQATPVREFIAKNKLSPGVYLQADSKRYYPYSTLASHVVGFVNSENAGAYGLESVYETELAGQKGRILTQKTAKSVEMLSSYETYIDAENGNNISLTIDSTIQGYLERTLETGVERFEAQNGGFGIIMNPKTGEIYAMAGLPDYDLNVYSEISDTGTLAKLDSLKKAAEAAEAEEAAAAAAVPTTTNTSTATTSAAEGDTEATLTKSQKLWAEYNQAYNTAQIAQWRNKNIVDGYEPGSTFKPLVVAMGLEEGIITPEATFVCGGRIKVPGWEDYIHCHQRGGHGTQDVTKVLMNSCNPAMIQIGQRIGNETFYQYFKDYGLREKTGIDLQSEGVGFFWPESSFKYDTVSLAVASFGQRFEVTPIGMISAFASVINGGHLMEPYVVQSVSDTEGNVLSYREPTEVRQVISQQTSDTVRGMLERVVSDRTGSGKNAKVEGYSIGGKTGTSEVKLEKGRYVVSFIGFAPVEDPEVIVLLAYDNPKPAAKGSMLTSGNYYISGGNMPALLAGPLIADTLEYLGIAKEGSAATADVSVPKLTDKTLADAQQLLSQRGLGYKLVGRGGTVTDQTPRSGVSIPSGSNVVLYLGEEKTTNKVVVPDLTGRTFKVSKAALEDRGLYMKAPGVENAANMVAFSQTIAAGTEVDAGTVVEVRFRDNSVRDYG